MNKMWMVLGLASALAVAACGKHDDNPVSETAPTAGATAPPVDMDQAGAPMVEGSEDHAPTAPDDAADEAAAEEGAAADEAQAESMTQPASGGY